MGSGSSAVSDNNTMRCPMCGWVSVTKMVFDAPHIGLMFNAIGDHFICTNLQCKVERIFGDNAVMLMKNATQEEA